MAAVRLYGAQTGNSRRAAIALEEADIPYSVIRVDLRAGEHKTAAFRALNPRGLIPATKSICAYIDGQEHMLLTF